MRLRILQRVIFAGLAVLWVALFFIQVIDGSRYRRQSEKNRTRLIHLPAARGAILDRRGVPIAEDRITFELAALPQELVNPGKVWSDVAPMVGLSAEELAKRYKKGFQAKYSPVSLVRNLPSETAFRIEEEKVKLPGILVRPVPERVYPMGPAVGGVVGYLGLIAPEELTKLKSYGYTYKDRVGKDGLEKQYDSMLRGQDGGLHVEVNAQGKLVQQLGFLKPRRGRNIKVSVDARLQQVAYGLLEGGAGTAIVMDCKTGELLCLVSSPSFDPNAFMDANRQAEIRAMLKDPSRPMFNRSFRAAVPPGSTFKAIVAYEALTKGKINPATTFECRGGLFPGRPIFRCWQEDGHSFQTVTQGLQHSCNVFFYNTGRRLGVKGIAEAARMFGLGKPTGLDLSGESAGLVPDPDWMRSKLKQEWQEGDTLSFALGQSALLTTPLQMARAFATIGDGGWMPTPHLLLSVEKEPKEDEKDEAAAPVWETPERTDKGTQLHLDPSSVATVKEGLEMVVNTDSGTGRLARLPNDKVAGKTGTAQAPPGRSHAWFCGFVPAEAPRYSFVVFLEHGGKGGLHAAKVVGGLLVAMKEMEYL